MTPKVAAVRRKDETTTRSNKNGDYRIHTKTWLPPTVREIAKMTGYKSVSSVQGHLVKMFELGILETDEKLGASRAIRVPGYKFEMR